jgi:histidinol-phosphate aminotransferase
LKLQSFIDGSLAIRPYRPGISVKDLAEQLKTPSGDVLKLNANENLFLPQSFMKRVLVEAAEESDPRLYPEDRETLREAISRYVGVDPSQIVITASGDQGINLVLTAFLGAGGVLRTISPTFSMYRRTALTLGLDYNEVSLNNDFSLDVKSLSSNRDDLLTVICNPNNPTGNQFPRDDVLIVVDTLDTPVLVDEAYSEYGEYSLAQETNNYENLVVLRTFSKAFGLAGMRLGYLVAEEDVAETLNERFQMPYPVPGISLRVGVKLLEALDLVVETVNKVKSEREWLGSQLNNIKGVNAFPSDTNFITFNLDRDCEQVYRSLLGRGIIIRKIGTMLEQKNCLRVTVAPRDMNKRFLSTLKEVLK